MDEMCKALTSLSSTSSLQTVVKCLDPIVRNHGNDEHEQLGSKREIKRCSTPLMLACDKSCKSFLQYVVEKCNPQPSDITTNIHSEAIHQNTTIRDMIPHNKFDIEELIGHPLQHSPDGGNTPIHYAAMSGFHEALGLLAKMLYFQRLRYHGYKESIAQPTKSIVTNSILQCYIELLQQRNDNDDTPIMMTAIDVSRDSSTPTEEGNVNILEKWLREILQMKTKLDSSRHTEDPLIPPHLSTIQILQRIQSLLAAKNLSGDTALSIACGHGNVSVVNTLVHNRSDLFNTEPCKTEDDHGHSTYLLYVSHKDIVHCKESMTKTANLLEMLKAQKRSMKQYDSKGQSLIDECEEKIKQIKRCLVTLQVYASKQSEQAAKELLEQCHANDGEKHARDRQPPAKVKNKKSQETDRKNHITPMKGNKKNVSDERNEKPTVDTSVEVNDSRPMTPTQAMESIEYNTMNMDTDSGAEMESLCLDTSMLLLNAHGLAFLSPSQLEAVESILKKQLNAVSEARIIHQRMKTSMKERNDDT